MIAIEIRAIKGVFTNADPADIPPEYAAECQNLRPINGKLVKTYGMGKRIDTVLPAALKNLAVMTHDSLMTPTGYVILGASIVNSTLTVYGYQNTPAWTDIRTLFTVTSDVFFQKEAQNPIIKDSDIIRFLPGNVDYADRQFAITAASASSDTLTIAGDYTGYLTAGVLFAVIGSTGNIGAYKVLSSTLTGGNTVISVDTTYRAVSEDTAAGSIVFGSLARGLWLGYIDRSLYDEIVTVTPGFYGYPTKIESPNLTFHLSELNGGTLNPSGTGQVASYRFSYVYDGVQESLLTDNPVSWDCSETSTVKISFSVPYTTSKRITAIKAYRSIYDMASSVQGAYKLIHTVNFLRKADTVQGDTDGAYSARDWMHIPGAVNTSLSTSSDYMVLLGKSYAIHSIYGAGPLHYVQISGDYTADFAGATSMTLRGTSNDGVYAIDSVDLNSGYTRVHCSSIAWSDNNPISQILLRGTTYNIADVPTTGTGHEVFALDSSGPITTDQWNVEWELWERTGTTVKVAGGNAGCYTGWNTVIVSETLTPNEYGGGILLFPALDSNRAVLSNTTRAVHVSSSVSDYNDVAWSLLSTSKGLYAATDNTTAANYVFYDTGLTAGAEHPLDGEESITVHGAFGRIIAGRLWQGDIVLDPGGDNSETHRDWVSWSEIDQPDVNPVSNVIRLTDEEGGPLTGVASLFGNPVILKRQAILTIGAKNSAPPFAIIASAHNIGNIAPYGYVMAGIFLYVVWRDGIYRLAPNNLAASDSTPTEQLRITGPIEDIYLALTQAQKEAITGEYEPVRGEVIWTLGSETWAYNTETEAWREIASAVTPGVFARDENGNLVAYRDSDKKIYTFSEEDAKESTGILLRTKAFEISRERKEVVRYVSVTHKSVDALTLEVISEDDVPSGKIEYQVSYTVTGYTKVTYNGTDYTAGATFTGIAGVSSYTVTGTGKVQVIKSYTIPASYDWNTCHVTPRLRAKRVSVRISGAGSANSVEIGEITMGDEK